MKVKNISKIAIVAALTAVLPGCHIYNKFDLPDDNALAQEYVKATEAEADSSAFGNLPWQEVFTDPMLADLITRALDNNKDLRNAKLNVDIAHAQMKGARLSYLPSLALNPNGAGAPTPAAPYRGPISCRSPRAGRSTCSARSSTPSAELKPPTPRPRITSRPYAPRS